MALRLPAFAGVGLELEYAIVDGASLDVRPLADRLLAALAGAPAADAPRGALGWSNELVAHVVELKNLAPVPSLAGLADAFQAEIANANALLAREGARLMPTGMHPWMDPHAETALWTHDGAGIYAAYDRIFDCRRHGWANLQSMHVNLPFADDREFARLHAAIRVVLPLIPALAASSPVAQGALQPELDHRLEVYRTHADVVPAVVGAMIPEPVATRDDYERRILAPLYRAIAPLDPAGTLQREWLNARAAIARFDRSAIEIRLCDTQECVDADIAVAAAIAAVVRALYEEAWSTTQAQQALPTERLAAILRACVRDAERAPIDDPAYRAVLGLHARERTAGAAWQGLVERCEPGIAALDPRAGRSLALIAAQGPLARRIRAALGGRAEDEALREVYRRLCACLAAGTHFSVA